MRWGVGSAEGNDWADAMRIRGARGLRIPEEEERTDAIKTVAGEMAQRRT